MYGGWFEITLRWLIQRLNKNTDAHFFESNIGLLSNSQSNTSKCFFNNQIHMLRSHHSLVYSKTDVCTDCTTLPWKIGSLSVFLGQGHFTILFKILKRIHSLPLCTELYIDRQTDGTWNVWPDRPLLSQYLCFSASEIRGLGGRGGVTRVDNNVTEIMYTPTYTFSCQEG